MIPFIKLQIMVNTCLRVYLEYRPKTIFVSLDIFLKQMSAINQLIAFPWLFEGVTIHPLRSRARWIKGDNIMKEESWFRLNR
jgi:hypothetical protein